MTEIGHSYIVVHSGKVLCQAGGVTRHRFEHLSALGLDITNVAHGAQLLGRHGDHDLFLLPILDSSHDLVGEVEGAAGSSWHWADLRELIAGYNEADYYTHARAVQYFHWLREHQYCGVCGSTTSISKSENALQCSACGKHWFPRIQPCIITLIHRGDQVLLAKHARYINNMYSCIAGFVESGESLEQCIHREIDEEVGLKVHNLRYFGSQAWPFPYQLMVGYYAEYLSGDIVLDDHEIDDARWWSIHDLPHRPSTTSISGQLIEHYVASYLAKPQAN